MEEPESSKEKIHKAILHVLENKQFRDFLKIYFNVSFSSYHLFIFIPLFIFDFAESLLLHAGFL